MNKADWKVHFNKFLKHIAHDLQKGIDNKVYKWDTITVDTTGGNILVKQGNTERKVSLLDLGTENQDYKDNFLTSFLQVSPYIYTINSQETKTMVTSKTQSIVENAESTIKTVASQIKDSALISAKMEAGENILLALRNIVMQKAGFMQKVKFKFAPILLDTAVTVGADILVAELFPEKKSAKIAVECLNLAMTKEILHALPIKDFTNALTGGESLQRVLDMVKQD